MESYNPAGETVVPISSLISRLEKHRDEMQRQVNLQPWWNLKRRWIFGGATAAYQYEIDALLELGGATVMHRLVAKLGGTAFRE